MRLSASTATKPAWTWPASAIDAWTVSLTRLTDAAAATATPVFGSSLLLAPVLPPFVVGKDAAGGVGLAGAAVWVALAGLSSAALATAPATVKAQTSPSTRASTSTPPSTSMWLVLPMPLPATAFGSPMTARVWRLRSLTATEMPTPTDSPLAMPPAQVAVVVWSSAVISTLRPVTSASLPSCASVSLVWPA